MNSQQINFFDFDNENEYVVGRINIEKDVVIKVWKNLNYDSRYMALPYRKLNGEYTLLSVFPITDIDLNSLIIQSTRLLANLVEVHENNSSVNILKKEIDVLSQAILEYESDTFSSSDYEITLYEVEQIMSILLSQIQVDGVILSDLLDNLRYEKDLNIIRD